MILFPIDAIFTIRKCFAATHISNLRCNTRLLDFGIEGVFPLHEEMFIFLKRIFDKNLRVDFHPFAPV